MADAASPLANYATDLEEAIRSGDVVRAGELAKKLAEAKAGITCNIENGDSTPASVETIRVKVNFENRMSTGTSVNLDLPPRCTVKSLKQKIADRFSFPSEVQQCILGRRLLHDTDTLTTNDLQANVSGLYIYLRVASDVGLSRSDADPSGTSVVPCGIVSTPPSVALNATGGLVSVPLDISLPGGIQLFSESLRAPPSSAASPASAMANNYIVDTTATPAVLEELPYPVQASMPTDLLNVENQSPPDWPGERYSMANRTDPSLQNRPEKLPVSAINLMDEGFNFANPGERWPDAANDMEWGNNDVVAAAARRGDEDWAQWSCSKCTFINNGMIEVCEMCDNPRTTFLSNRDYDLCTDGHEAEGEGYAMAMGDAQHKELQPRRLNEHPRRDSSGGFGPITDARDDRAVRRPRGSRGGNHGQKRRANHEFDDLEPWAQAWTAERDERFGTNAALYAVRKMEDNPAGCAEFMEPESVDWTPLKLTKDDDGETNFTEHDGSGLSLALNEEVRGEMLLAGIDYVMPKGVLPEGVGCSTSGNDGSDQSKSSMDVGEQPTQTSSETAVVEAEVDEPYISLSQRQRKMESEGWGTTSTDLWKRIDPTVPSASTSRKHSTDECVESVKECYENLVASTTKLELVPNRVQFECPICLEVCLVDTGVVLRDCLHMFCIECLAEHIRLIQKAVVICPFDNGEYQCEIPINEREIRALVDSVVYQKHLALSIREVECQLPDSYHCTTPNCSGWCTFDGTVKNFFCYQCRRENCLTCRAIHDGYSCEHYQTSERARIARHNAAMSIEHLLERGESMDCPRCKVCIVKQDGCDFVRCTMCQLDICWITRQARWGPAGRGDTSGGCQCRAPENNFRMCHPSCGNCH